MSSIIAVMTGSSEVAAPSMRSASIVTFGGDLCGKLSTAGATVFGAVDPTAAKDYSEFADVLVLSDGPPVHWTPDDPYPKERSDGNVSVDVARDQFEFELYRAFSAAGKPVIGIGRGMNVINVACGGTLREVAEAAPGVLNIDDDVLASARPSPPYADGLSGQVCASLGEGVRMLAASADGVAAMIGADSSVSIGMLGLLAPDRHPWSRDALRLLLTGRVLAGERHST